MFYYIHANDCGFCKQVTNKIIERMMIDDGLEVMRLEQDSIEHKQLLKKNKKLLLPNVTPFFFNSESKHYLRGATYATYHNLKKLHQGGLVLDYKEKKYYGEVIPGIHTKEQKPDPKKPTTLSMARSLAGQMWESIKGKANGKDIFCDEEKAKLRWEICQECPLLDKNTERCKSCGCFMKIKCHISETKCPEKKW